jgi:hypothetical protein
LFNFSAYRYTDKNISASRHINELVETGFITLNIDYRQQAIGTATCGEGYRDKYLLTASDSWFSFRLRPADFNASSATDIAKTNLLRLQNQVNVLETVQITSSKPIFNEPLTISLTHPDPKTQLRYTLDGSEPDSTSTLYKNPFTLTHSAIVTGKAFKTGSYASFSTLRKEYVFVPVNKVSIEPLPDKMENPLSLVDGVKGKMGNLTGEWIGIAPGNDFNATIEFSSPQQIKTCSLRFMEDWYNRQFAPSQVSIETSEDGKTYQNVYNETFDSSPMAWNIYLKTFNCPVNKLNVKYLRILAKNNGFPIWWKEMERASAGMMTDEILLEYGK